VFRNTHKFIQHLNKVPEEKLQWLAGIIDSEGTIHITNDTTKGRRPGSRKNRRTIYISIATCDAILVPEICSWFDEIPHTYKSYNGTKVYSTRWYGKCAEAVLQRIRKYLYTKQPQAELAILAYNDKQNIKFVKSEISKLNARGIGAPLDVFHRKHTFTWPWLAGMIDGDGCISVGLWKKTSQKGRGGQKPSIKPYIAISLAHRKTVDYIASCFGVGKAKSGSPGHNGTKRRGTVKVRFMTSKIIEIVPKLEPHLVLKRDKAKLAYKISILKSTRTNNGNHTGIDTQISMLLDELKGMNGPKGSKEKTNGVC